MVLSTWVAHFGALRGPKCAKKISSRPLHHQPELLIQGSVDPCFYVFMPNSEHFLFLLTDVDLMWSSAAGAHLLQGLTYCAFCYSADLGYCGYLSYCCPLSLWNSLTSFALIICKPLVSTLVINEVRSRLLSSKSSMQSDFFCIQRSHPLLVTSNKAGSVLLHWLHYSHPYKQSMAKTLFSKWWAHSGNTYKKQDREGD